MKFNKTFWVAVFTLTGTTVGAGILGLPYVFSKSGFLVGAFWLILIGAISTFVNLSLGEVVLRTKTFHQIPGYAKKYIGKFGGRVIFFAVVFGIYSALIAYLVGEGQSLSKLFFGTLDYAIYFALAFWAMMTLILKKGLRGLKKVELYGVIAIIGIIIIMFLWFVPNINLNNLNTYDLSNLFFPFGVILFSLLGFTSIPEIRKELQKNEKLFKKAIIVGSLIPVALYFIFTLIFVGVLGNSVEQISTLSFGNLVIILGIFTMLTSYFVLSFALRDIFIYDLRKRNLSFFFVSVFPLLIYFLITFFNLLDFVKVLGIGGVISGGIAGVLILIMNLKAKKKGKRKPEFSIPLNWFVIGILSLIFIAGIFLEIF